MAKSYTKNPDSGTLLCQPCLIDRKRFTPSVYCLDCKECQCSRCYEVHRRFSYMKGHETIDIEPRQTMTHITRFCNYCTCKIHNKKIEYICTYENMLCCRKCKRENHRYCQNVYHIGDVATENPEKFVDLKSKAYVLRNQLLTVSKFLNKSEQELDSGSQLDDLRRELHDTKEKLMKRLDDFSSHMLKIGQIIIQGRKATHVKNADACEKIKTDLHEMFELIDSCEHTSVLQKFIFQHILEKQFMDCQDKSAILYAQLQVPGRLTVSYDKKMESVVQNKFSFGDVHFRDTPFNFNTIPDYRAVRIELSRSRTFQKRALEDADITPRVTEIDFRDDGTLVIVDNISKTRRIYNEKLVQTKCDTEYRPRYTTLISDGKGVAIYPRFANFYEIKDKQIYHTKQVPTHSNNDTASIRDAYLLIVCVSAGNTRPEVTISDSSRVEDFNFKLPEVDATLTKSLFFKTKISEIIVVSVKDWNTIIIVDMEKKAIGCFANDGNICQPGYMCVGPSDTFFVCCWSDKIVQMSVEGSILGVLNTSIPEPKVISMSEDQTKLAVAGNGQLHVYNIIQD